jgi:hypothetical protein
MAKARSADRRRYWQAVIERQQVSGQSIVGFCSKEGLAPASFHAWKRRVRRSRHGIEMRLSDLTLILEGIDLASVRHRPRWRRA